jgi:hypothetical protein
VADAPPPLDVSKTNFGMFVGVGPGVETRMADEAAKKLWETYPPPKNLLDFQQRIAETDSFGRRLMVALQRNGYFVHQWHDPVVAPQCGQRTDEAKSGEYRRVPVCYLVDDVSGMLRLTLFAAGEAWSRFFNTEQGKLVPVGAWSRQSGR